MLQHAQRDQRRQALTIGRNFVQMDAAIFLRDRLDPFGVMIRQIVCRHQSAARFRVRDDFCREFSPIKRFAARLCDQLQRSRMIRQLENITRRGPRPLGAKVAIQSGQSLNVST